MRPYAEVKSQLDALRVILPTARYVFLSRDASEVVASDWWRYFRASHANVRKQTAMFAQYATSHPDHCLHITFEQLRRGDHGQLCDFCAIDGLDAQLRAGFMQ